MKVSDELITPCEGPEQIVGGGGLFDQLTKAVMDRVLQGELTHHLGYEKGRPATAAEKRDNWRNGREALESSGALKVQVWRALRLDEVGLSRKGSGGARSRGDVARGGRGAF